MQREPFNTKSSGSEFGDCTGTFLGFWHPSLISIEHEILCIVRGPTSSLSSRPLQVHYILNFNIILNCLFFIEVELAHNATSVSSVQSSDSTTVCITLGLVALIFKCCQIPIVFIEVL